MIDVVESRYSLTKKYLADLNEVSEKRGLQVRAFDERWWTLYLLQNSLTNYVVKRRERNLFFGRWEKLAYVEPEPTEEVWKLVVEKPHEEAIRPVADEMISKGYKMDLVVNEQKTTR